MSKNSVVASSLSDKFNSDRYKYEGSLFEQEKTGRKQVDNVEAKRVDNVEDKRVDNVEAKQVDNVEDKRVDNVEDKRVDNVEDKRVDNLMGLQLKILKFVFSKCKNNISPPITLTEITKGIRSKSKNTVKNAIFILTNKKKILISLESKEGRGGWRKYKIDATIHELLTHNKQVENR